MLTCYVRRGDYPGADGWRLLEWCMRRGADEFSLEFLGPPYLPRTEWARMDELLAPFRRRVASAGDRWLLNGETFAVLREMMADGPFGFAPGTSSLEDLTVFRGGGAMLRVVTRDGLGILQLRDDEGPSLERAGLPHHLRAV
ncbi:MAG TPA: hypothetical protein VFK16_05560 [Gemmatimonadaceae bacterium]|jgi:hypothetical protein|nr:hypothetical protein [Gemmatimonadaceae bacterium]